MSALQGHRDGDTYEPVRDYVRLNSQMLRVYQVMVDRQWHTLARLAHQTNDPEASISARLRDFRKMRFGGHTVERRNAGEGLWQYRLIWNEVVPRPLTNTERIITLSDGTEISL